jgi:hypothetical protein
VSFVMICQAAKRSAEAQTSLDRLCQMDASITQAYQLPQAFLAMVLERRGRDLEAWITAATDSGIDALASFARGMQEGLAAIKAGITLPWSNEHVAYCTSSPASWPVEGTDPPATTAWRDRLWGTNTQVPRSL